MKTMKDLKYKDLANRWTALSAKYYGRKFTRNELKELVSKPITLNNGMFNAYVQFGILVAYGNKFAIVGQYATEANIERVYNVAHSKSKAIRDRHAERVKVNASIEVHHSAPTLEVMVGILRKAGYFVIKPEKGQKITVTNEYNF